MLTKLISLVGIALALNAAPAVAQSAQCAAQISGDLETVGETRLRVMFFKVYDATLMTDTGNYLDAGTVALQLSYLRDVDAEKLVETTKEQWEKLDYSIGETEQAWLNELQTIWPDVREGDCLLAYHEPDKGVQFYSADGELGQIESDEFADKFLAIWLDEDSSYRKNRNELIGEQE
jgi:hypothetical protein